MLCDTPQTNPRQVANELKTLPAPDDAMIAHSEALITRIDETMKQAGGAIPFAQYMAMALYEPGLGYYSAGSHKLGAAGDFITAPEISQLFSRVLARQCAEVLAEIGGEVLEFGAGSGVMAADMLAELERLDCLPQRYAILEVSADLRQRQRDTLQQKVPHLLERVVWLDALPTTGFIGVVVANEVLDAMPVHRFRVTDAGVEEQYVQRGERGYTATYGAAQSEALSTRLAELARQQALAAGYESEINLAAEEWIGTLGNMLERGVIVLIDYGFPAAEFYHPERRAGTLMCHYRHRAHDDPFVYPGLQDITAHVDFTAMADAALAAGLNVSGFTNQASFLMGCGLLELVGTDDDPQTQITNAAAVKKLTLPSEMGELFKVLGLSRGWDQPLRGFALRDERHRL